MDSLKVTEILQKEFPFIKDIIDALPGWAWLIIGWFFINLLLKPYMEAILRIYQPKFDAAARKTPSIFKRIFIEILRIVLMYPQTPFIIYFLLVPKKKRLRAFRKNEVIFFIWLFSKRFPNLKYYSRVRSWFEENVYLNKKTSYIHPEPLKLDEPYINEVTKKDLEITHELFCQKYKEEDFIKTVRVGIALKELKPLEWMGKRLFVLWVIFSWGYIIIFLSTLYFVYTKTFEGLICLPISIALFKLDRHLLTKRIIQFAIMNKNFYYDAIRTRVLQFHW